MTRELHAGMCQGMAKPPALRHASPSRGQATPCKGPSLGDRAPPTLRDPGRQNLKSSCFSPQQAIPQSQTKTEENQEPSNRGPSWRNTDKAAGKQQSTTCAPRGAPLGIPGACKGGHREGHLRGPRTPGHILGTWEAPKPRRPVREHTPTSVPLGWCSHTSPRKMLWQKLHLPKGRVTFFQYLLDAALLEKPRNSKEKCTDLPKDRVLQPLSEILCRPPCGLRVPEGSKLGISILQPEEPWAPCPGLWRTQVEGPRVHAHCNCAHTPAALWLWLCSERQGARPAHGTLSLCPAALANVRWQGGV